MDKWLFFFTSDIRFCLLYKLQHIGGDNPRLMESNPRYALKKFMLDTLDIQPFDNLVFMTLHFATIRPDIRNIIKRTHRVYARLWLRLQGRHWRKNPYPSVTVVERGKGNILHVHTILNMRNKTQQQLEVALDKAYPSLYEFGATYDTTFHEDYKKAKNYTPIADHILIKPVFDLNGLENYITKEFNWLLINPKIDFGNFYTSETLFPITETDAKRVPGLHKRKRPI
ncbi:MAG: hypothetical protein LBD50_01085 [Rickettsiales bacterium]|jgi:hypothetical protein|nr:hypothetical protein [Rickettsiales bacterium]